MRVSMKQFIVLILALAAVLPLRAQEVPVAPAVPNNHENRPGAPVGISPDAKAMAMGGVQMSTISTSHTIFNNPSTIVFARLPYQLSASYVHMNDLNQFVISGHLIFARNNAFQVGWRNYNNHSDGKSQALDLNYTRKITDRWSMGLTGRYYHRKYFSVKKEAVAVDLSTTYVLPLSFGVQSNLRSGAKVGNLGGWIGEGGALPVHFAFGTALDTHFTDAHQLTFGIDFAYYARKNYIRGGQLSFGAEYNLMQLIQLRAGYHVGSNSRYNPNYSSLGCGVRFLHLRLDFAYLIANKQTPLHNTYSLSFGFDM